VILVTTSSVDGTRAVARVVADHACAGDLFVLAGDLGAGKTAFTQGLGAGLGVRDPITSPTFTLANRYEGRLRLHHLDVYRLERLDEVADLDIAGLLDDDAVTVVEWGDTIRPALPPDYLQVRFTFGDADDDREVLIDAVGPTWNGRLATLADALEELGPC